MRKIIITQRSFFDPQRNEFFDGLDQQFSILFADVLNLIPISSGIMNIRDFLENIECDGIIFSGGNSVIENESRYCKKRLRCEQEILSYSKEHSIPVVGICYGMQVMNHYYGGTVNRIDKHVRTVHSIKIEEQRFEVNSYHEQAIFLPNLALDFDVLGICDDMSIEAIIHKTSPWLGIMWHPERPMKKQELWVDLIKSIFLRKIVINKKDILNFLKASNE